MQQDFQLGDKQSEFDERVVEIRRVFKVHKGGGRQAFRALVVVGDGKGSIGAGVGKALGVPEAIRKGFETAKKHMFKVPLIGTTIPHAIIGKTASSKVILKPAAPGTGVIAGTSVRAVLEAAGVKDVLSKVIGSRNKVNCVYATLNGLRRLRHPNDVAKMRNKAVDDLPLPLSMKKGLKADEPEELSQTQVGAQPDRVFQRPESHGEGFGAEAAEQSGGGAE